MFLSAAKCKRTWDGGARIKFAFFPLFFQCHKNTERKTLKRILALINSTMYIYKEIEKNPNLNRKSLLKIRCLFCLTCCHYLSATLHLTPCGLSVRLCPRLFVCTSWPERLWLFFSFSDNKIASVNENSPHLRLFVKFSIRYIYIQETFAGSPCALCFIPSGFRFIFPHACPRTISWV